MICRRLPPVQRIANLNEVDPLQARAYGELTPGGDPFRRRIDFVYEDGSGIVDTFFLFRPVRDNQAEL